MPRSVAHWARHGDSVRDYWLGDRLQRAQSGTSVSNCAEPSDESSKEANGCQWNPGCSTLFWMDGSENELQERLLQSGCVILYFDPVLMEEHSSRLVKEGWEYREIYTGMAGTLDELYDQVSTALEFPGFFGRNLNAFRDCLSYIPLRPNGRLALGLIRFDLLAKKEPKDAQIVLNIFAERERACLMRGERILFMVQTSDPDIYFEPVGEQPVGWNFDEWLDSKRKRKEF